MNHCRILVMGLPGAGKTTLAAAILKYLESYDMKCIWLNADRVREEYDDWDFSVEGRIRQSWRMKALASQIECDYAIADFVAPLVEMRDNFDAKWTIWVDTIAEGRFADTNNLFVEPTNFDFRIKTQDAEYWGKFIAECILADGNN
jgi:adenylylsulfate kinase